ncbi:hypothetical protein E2C01_025662 [Portunus trituberculatus]|uniref:Uncharacterized protein n=1 Tax=Portunus trituberculatus TaxID=210409 RepID=A0A5B7EDY3_PORTR|nr:hypothetical protein [Portunus trituberculatus]
MLNHNPVTNRISLVVSVSYSPSHMMWKMSELTQALDIVVVGAHILQGSIRGVYSMRGKTMLSTWSVRASTTATKAADTSRRPQPPRDRCTRPPPTNTATTANCATTPHKLPSTVFLVPDHRLRPRYVPPTEAAVSPTPTASTPASRGSTALACHVSPTLASPRGHGVSHKGDDTPASSKQAMVAAVAANTRKDGSSNTPGTNTRVITTWYTLRRTVVVMETAKMVSRNHQPMRKSLAGERLSSSHSHTGTHSPSSKEARPTPTTPHTHRYGRNKRGARSIGTL